MIELGTISKCDDEDVVIKARKVSNSHRAWRIFVAGGEELFIDFAVGITADQAQKYVRALLREAYVMYGPKKGKQRVKG